MSQEAILVIFKTRNDKDLEADAAQQVDLWAVALGVRIAYGPAQIELNQAG